MKNVNVHYAAQQIKSIAGEVEKLLFPFPQKRDHVNKVRLHVRRLARVLRVSETTIKEWTLATLKEGMVWSIETDDLVLRDTEDSATKALIEKLTLDELVWFVWEDRLPYWRTYYIPSTRDVMDIIQK